MKKSLLLLVLFVSVSGFSQFVNDYQYVIVPTQFSIFKENDKYRLNSTTKLLLEKYGFKVYMSNEEIPNGIGDNCQRLYADLVQDKDFMVTKIKIVLKDCREKVVYQTELGKSREKDYAVAYNQALRETAKSFDKLNYKYNGKNDAPAPPRAPVKGTVKAEEMIYGDPESEPATVPVTATGSSEVFFFAQPIANGFQIVDNEPKVIMKMFNTSAKNVFIASKDGRNGVVISKNGQWFFEYYDNGKLISEALKLKF